MPLHRLLISFTLISSWTSADLLMPKDRVLGKENYLQMINVPEFNCLKRCALKLNIEPLRDDEPADNRPFNSKCENLDIHSSCKIPASALVPLHENRYYFMTQQKVTWYQALQFCRKLNLQLATIDSDALAGKIAGYLLTKSLQTTTFWSGGFAFHSVEGGQVWVETGNSVLPTLVNNGNKATQNTALSFTVDPASRKLRWAEEPPTKPNSFVCAVPDECFTQRCMAS